MRWVQWVQADEDVVFEAVKQNRFAFRFAAESLRTAGQEPHCPASVKSQIEGMISSCASEDTD